MSDLIDRQAAIDAHCKLCGDRGLCNSDICPDVEVFQLLLPSSQPEQRWIPCSERLPHSEYGESDNVLTTCCLRDYDEGYRFVRTLYYNGGGIWCYPTGETFEDRVLAWMPIPKPYGKGDENG